MSGEAHRLVAVGANGAALALLRPLGEVVSLAIVPVGEDAPLQSALARGAARAIGVWDEAVAQTDYYGLAQVLACAVRKLGAEVVVVEEDAASLIGPALADRLGVPHLSGASSLDWEDGRVVASWSARGRRYRMAARPPLLLSLGCGVRPPAEPARTTSAMPERWSLHDVGVAAAEIRWRRRFAPRRVDLAAVLGAPAQRPRPLRFASAEDLAERLRAEGFVPRAAAPREGDPAALAAPTGGAP